MDSALFSSLAEISELSFETIRSNKISGFGRALSALFTNEHCPKANVFEYQEALWGSH
jgi:hypothetical protein